MHDYALTLLGNFALLSTLALSAYLILLMGELSFGQQGFFAGGAYVAALVTAGYGYSPLIACLLAILAGASLGLALGLSSIPIRGLTFCLSTFAFGEMIRSLLGTWYFDPDGSGPRSGPAGVEGFGNIRYIFESGMGLFGATAIVVVVAICLFALIVWGEKTLLGVRIRAIGQDGDLARQLGLRVNSIKVFVLALSGSIAALAGAVFAHFSTFIEPANFGVMLGIHTLAYVLIGGVGHPVAILIGAGLDVFVLSALNGLSSYRMIIFGGAVALLLRFKPEGLLDVATVRRLTGLSRRQKEVR